MATFTAADVTLASVQAAVNLASAGDTVIVPAGSASWTGQCSISVPIIIHGAGTIQTTQAAGLGSTGSKATLITNLTGSTSGQETPLFNVNLAVDQRFEIFGFYLQSQGVETATNGSNGINVFPNGVIPKNVVIHDITFDSLSFAINNGTGAAGGSSSCFGVVYNCTFINCRICSRNAGYYKASQLYGASIPSPAWGTANYMIYEDNLIQFGNFGSYPFPGGWSGGPQSGNYTGDTEFPMNYMVRFCNGTVNRLPSVGVTVDMWEMHGSGNCLLPNDPLTNNFGYVMHDNVFTYTGSSTQVKLADIRGGVGCLVYNNTIHGQNGGNYTRIRTDPPGSVPPTQYYTWGNVEDDANNSLMNSGVIGPPTGYTEVAYPSPLRAGTTPPIVRPTLVASSFATSSISVERSSGGVFLPTFEQFAEQDYGTGTSISTGTVLLLNAQNAGDLIAIFVAWHPAPSTVVSVTDTVGNTYVSAVGATVFGTRAQQGFYAKNVVASGGGANTITVTFSASSIGVDLRALVYRSCDKVAPLDQTALSSGATTTATCGAITTLFPVEVIVAAIYSPDSVLSFTNGYLQRSTGFELVIELGTSTAGVYADSATMSAADGWIMQIMTFQAQNIVRPTLVANAVSSAFFTIRLIGGFVFPKLFSSSTSSVACTPRPVVRPLITLR